MPTWLALILALLDLSLLVIVHEFGHFMAAKMVGVWPEEFGIGLPPRVWGKKFGETLFSFNALPLGGFVRLHGEVSDEKPAKPDRAFSKKSRIARGFVALAGIFMNFAFAAVLFTIMFFILQDIPKGAVVLETVEGSPGAEAQVMEGDQVVAINNITVVDTDDFPRSLERLAGEEVDLVVMRNGQEVTLPLQVRELPDPESGYTGIAYQPIEIYTPPTWQQPFVYTWYGVRETWFWTERVTTGIISLFQGVFTGNVPGGVAGPVGVTATLSEFIKYGLVVTLQFTAIISINLALVNMLPFPPLDGSRVVLLVVEAVVGKKHVDKYERRILEVGMAILLLLVLVLTLTEIPKIISAGSISQFVENLFNGT